jgi:hypothetical protein
LARNGDVMTVYAVKHVVQPHRSDRDSCHETWVLVGERHWMLAAITTGPSGRIDYLVKLDPDDARNAVDADAAATAAEAVGNSGGGGGSGGGIDSASRAGDPLSPGAASGGGGGGSSSGGGSPVNGVRRHSFQTASWQGQPHSDREAEELQEDEDHYEQMAEGKEATAGNGGDAAAAAAAAATVAVAAGAGADEHEESKEAIHFVTLGNDFRNDYRSLLSQNCSDRVQICASPALTTGLATHCTVMLHRPLRTGGSSQSTPYEASPISSEGFELRVYEVCGGPMEGRPSGLFRSGLVRKRRLRQLNPLITGESRCCCCCW